MRVLGIDPGLRNLGWGVIDVVGAKITHVANGICHSDADDGALADAIRYAVKRRAAENIANFLGFGEGCDARHRQVKAHV